MTLFLKLVILMAGLLLLYETLRRCGLWLNLVCTSFLPVILTPMWLSQNPDIGLFPWVKLYSLVISLTWINLARFTALGHRTWWRQGLVCLLLINILEAIIQDSQGSHLTHWLVIISGFLVILTLPSFRGAIQIDFATPTRDVTYFGMHRNWIVEYSVWNWAFVYLNFPQIAAHQLAVLNAAAIVGFIRPQLWLQARAYTLMADLMLLATFPKALILWTDSEHWSNPTRQWLVSAICLLIITLFSLRLLRRRRQARQPTFVSLSEATLTDTVPAIHPEK